MSEHKLEYPLWQKDKTEAAGEGVARELPVLSGPLQEVLALMVLAVAIGAVAFPLLTSKDYPVGADVLGHLFKVWHLTQRILETGTLERWMPEWYMGHSVLQYYPPLSIFAMLPINLLVGDILLVHKIFVFFSLWVGAVFVYLIARDWLGRVTGVCAGLIYVFAPYNLISAFSHGSHPKILTVALVPIIFYLILRLLQQPTRWLFLGVGLATGAMILTHHMEMVIVYICVAAFVLGYVILGNLPVSRLLIVSLAVVLGAGMQLWWLIPALTHFDLPNVPYQMPAQIWQQSYTVELIDPTRRFGGYGLTYLGVSLLAFGAMGAILRRDRLSWALLAATAIGLFFAVGVNNPLYLHIPVANRLLPERFLIPVSFLLALPTAAFVIFPFRRLKEKALGLILGALILAVVYLDFRPYLTLVRTTSHPSWTAAMTELGRYSSSGRFDYLLRNWGSEASYLPTVLGDKDQVRGWSIEGTPHWNTIENMGRALHDEYLKYVLRNLALWNVRYVMLDVDEPQLQRALESVNFRTIWSDQHFELMRSDIPSSYVMRQDRSIIAIGKGAEIAATIFPWLAQGTSLYIDDYDMDYLSTFDGVLLYGYLQRDEAAPERIIRELLRRGKTVFVDMRGAAQQSLFGVTQWIIDVPDDVTFSVPKSSPLDPGGDLSLKSFRYKNKPWRPNSYINLDGTIVEGAFDEQVWPLLGFENVEGGRVYFFGYDLFNHAKLTRDNQAVALIDSIFEVAHPNRALSPAPFEVENQDWEGQSLGFTYSSPDDAAVIVSVTYSPHWTVWVDGAPVKNYNHEYLNLLMLPAGRHTAKFVYGTTWIQEVSIRISAIAGVLMLVVVGPFWQKWQILGVVRSGDVLRELWRYANAE